MNETLADAITTAGQHLGLGWCGPDNIAEWQWRWGFFHRILSPALYAENGRVRYMITAEDLEPIIGITTDVRTVDRAEFKADVLAAFADRIEHAVEVDRRRASVLTGKKVA